jgi:hypothetical protein
MILVEVYPNESEIGREIKAKNVDFWRKGKNCLAFVAGWFEVISPLLVVPLVAAGLHGE